METHPESIPISVLLVEDNPADASLIRHVLDGYQPGRYRFRHVFRLEQATELAASRDYAIALLDLNLPDMQGPDTFSVLNEAAPRLPVIVLTGQADQQLALQLVQMGAQDFLLKDELDGALMSRAIGYAIARKKIELKLEEAAHFDGLTGLPNRTLFHDRLARAIARAKRRNSVIGLLFLDLDRFKEVNDTLGHAAGDDLLAQLGRRFASIVRKNDTVARMGGDEFTVIVEEVQSRETVLFIAQKLLQLFDEPFVVAGRDVRVGTSIGIAFSSDSGLDADNLLRHSDDAMYRAKGRGGNHFWVHDAKTQASAQAAAGEDAAEPCRGAAAEAVERAGADVLLVDDSPGDRRLVIEAFRQLETPHRLRIAADGEQAIACLQERLAASDLSPPRLILLDLNMPGNNGFDILRKIRALERISAIPVVVLSTSGSPGDIADAYRLGADAYVVKSDRFDQYVKLVGTLVSYWLDTVALPPAVGAGS